MARATVTLKEGKSYRWRTHLFTQKPTVITDPTEIEACKVIGVLSVSVEEDDDVEEAAPAPKPAAPKPAVKPPGAKPAVPAQKPAATAKPAPKPAPTAPKAESED